MKTWKTIFHDQGCFGACSRNALCTAVGLALCLAEPATARQAGRQLVSVEWNAGVHTVYDTNLERRHDGLASFGLVAAAGAGLRAGLGASGAALTYDYALYRYELSEHFNRSAHTVRTNLTIRPARPLLVAATAEYATGSASEDREIGSQLSLIPRVELRAGTRHRLRLQAGYRLRRFGDLSGEDVDNYLVSLDYRLGVSRRPTIELGSRFDTNTDADPRSSFDRWTHRLRFNAPVGAGAELNLGMQQSTRNYPHRLLHMEAGEDLAAEGVEWLARYQDAERNWPIPPHPAATLPGVPRRDEIWMPSLGFIWRTRAGLELELGYQFEARVSNDLRRGYSGHTTTFATRVRH